MKTEKMTGSQQASVRLYDDRVSEIIYLDVCCLKRPFDDTSAERVRREAEAVAAILEGAGTGKFGLVRSPAHDFENGRNPREDRRMATELCFAPQPSIQPRITRPRDEAASWQASVSVPSTPFTWHLPKLRVLDGSSRPTISFCG